MKKINEWIRSEVYQVIFELLDSEVDISGEDAGVIAAHAANAAERMFLIIDREQGESDESQENQH